MKLFSRTLAMILSLQLAIGCQGEQFKFSTSGGGIVGDDEIEISGSIARSFNVISDLVFPSAMAAESGTLQIYDATDPTDPQLLHKEEIVNQATYSVKFKKAEVEGLLLKVEFIGAAKSRVFLAKPEVAEKIISAPLTATRTAEHRIIFSSLERKVANFEIDKSSVKDAFDELKEADIASSLGVLGDQAYLEKLLGDSDYSKDVSLAMVEYLASKDQASQLELIHKLAAYVNVDKIDTELKVKCSGLNSYAIIPGEKVNYQLKFTPGKEISGIMKEEVSFVNDYRTANEKLLNYSKTLMGISEKLEIVTAKISLANEKGDVLYSSCILSNQEVVEDGSAEGPEYADLSVFEKFDPSPYKSYEEAQLALSSQRDKTKEMINGLLIKDGYKDPDLSNKLVDEMVYVDAAVKTAMANAYTFFSGGQQRRM